MSKKKIPGWPLSTLRSPPHPRIEPSADRCMWWGSLKVAPGARKRHHIDHPPVTRRVFVEVDHGQEVGNRVIDMTGPNIQIFCFFAMLSSLDGTVCPRTKSATISITLRKFRTVIHRDHHVFIEHLPLDSDRTILPGDLFSCNERTR